MNSGATRIEDTPTPPHLRIGGKYEIVRLIERGPATVLYEARNVRTERAVNIELLRVATDEESDVRARFLQEARTAAQFAHGNVISVYDVGETNTGSLYMVQERLGGERLSKCLERVGQLTLPKAVEILLPIMDALAIAHVGGLVHGSVCAEQIQLIPLSHDRCVPKLLDLGLSWNLAREGITRLTVGTRDDGGPALVPPELLASQDTLDPRLDVWGLTAVLYQCLTGQRPFPATNPYDFVRQVFSAEAPLASSVGYRIHPEVDAYLAKGLARDPEMRFGSIREAMSELVALADSTGNGLRDTLDDGSTEVFCLDSAEISGSVRRHAVRFGFLVPDRDQSTEAMATALEEAFDQDCVIHPFRTYADLVEALGEGEIDLAWLPPVAFMRAQRAGGAQLLLAVERANRPCHASALLGRRGEVDRIEQVRGKRAAWVDRWSAAGYLAPRALLAQHGINADRELVSQGFVGSFDAVLEALTDGTAQVGAAHCALGPNGRIIRSAWDDHHPVTVLAVRDAIPPETICGRPDLELGLAMKVIRSLSDPDKSRPLRRLVGASSFLLADPQNYDVLSSGF